MKQGEKPKKPELPPEDFVYGIHSPPHENFSDIINNTYGNRAEELIQKKYENFIAKKTKIYKRPKVVPRFISPKVEEMKKKEEERKAKMLDEPLDEEKENEEQKKPLYKLKMFLNVGSKVAESIKQFKTYKPFKVKNSFKEEENNGINKIINDVQEEVKQKEEVEQSNNLM